MRLSGEQGRLAGSGLPARGMGDTPVTEVELEILYRDERFVAVNKPPGLLVHRSGVDRGETRFAVQLLRDQIGQRVYPLHRLDKPTSGVLLFALSPAAARDYAAIAGRARKTYLAVVRGYPPLAGRIDHPLREQWDPLAGHLPREEAPVRAAVTDFRRLATVELPVRVDRYPTSRYALVAVCPRTGRRHQIRRHLKHIAHPVVGDTTHGKSRHNQLFRERFGVARLLLAATELVYPDPCSGAVRVVRAPLEPSMAALLAALGWPDPSRP